MSCILMADSCCDLSREYLEQRQIEVVHFSYVESDKPDGGLHGVDDLFQSLSAHEFYERMRQGACPMTSQPSQLEFEKVFKSFAESGDELVYLSVSSGISGCYEGARMALERTKEEFGKDLPIYILNTKLASTPLALLVSTAAEKRDEGLSASELYDWAREARNFVYVGCLVDDLGALHRGGRLPASVAVAGSMLDVKPLITINTEGKLVLNGVARGRKRAMKKMVDQLIKAYKPGAFSPKIALGNADCPQEFEDFIELVLSEGKKNGYEFTRDDCITTTIGPTIGSHVGANMLSIAYFGQDRRR